MSRAAQPLILIAAGGTGGHLFPAEALAGALARRGIAVELATDDRAAPFAGKFPARAIHVLPSDTVRSRNPLSLARTIVVLMWGTLRALWLLLRRRPKAVIGFGGYPTLPPLIAASILRVPTIIHEQNAVMGRANRWLAGRVDAIATGHAGLLSANAKLAGKAAYVGNPVRPAVAAAAKKAFAAPNPGEQFRLVVFGGSQGARVMSEVVPAAIEALPPALRNRIRIVQQCREADLDSVRTIYRRLDVPAEIAAFFPDLPSRVAESHLVIARSGASTVAEIAAIGRPAILVPLPNALDQDQLANASALAAAGGVLLIREPEFTPERVAAEISRLVAEPATLSLMATSARRMGRLDAAERLADLVLRVARILLELPRQGEVG
ncbi:MAG TPA: undecaprenyldiphospho-muramoylpentapeptide beta-N-acetylglucosaminyltransferase [Xanthobacteraceae bacterium]|jgi:UDP-N-acetylglucosamine--N-acetylmuramyl-(pentapeptide) pyrophosphoryl-undecaprenol N-acetylglucosamine transferase